MEALQEWLGRASALVWGLPTIILLLGTGVYFTLHWYESGEKDEDGDDHLRGATGPDALAGGSGADLLEDEDPVQGGTATARHGRLPGPKGTPSWPVAPVPARS